jgi:hypothetical protein
MAVVGHDQGETLSRVVHGLGVADVEHSQDEQRLAPEEELRLWRMARREVSKKWDILKLCSGVLDENVGWETSERERMFSENRKEWKIINVKTLSLKERKKVANPKLQNEEKKDIWMFWKTKNNVETQNETEVASE